ncbi:MAG: MFS transporter [Bdellovibrionota bacterium]
MDSCSSRCRKLVKASYLEGAFYALMVGMAETYALYYAVKQGIALPQLAMLSTLPILMGSMSQWIVPQIVKETSLRRAKLAFYVVQIVGLFCLCRSVASVNYYPWLFAALSLYWIGGMTSGPFWVQWMVNEIPSKAFGAFLSKRNAFVALCTLAAYLATAGYLNEHTASRDFLVVFSVGTIARIFSFASQIFLSRARIDWPERRTEMPAARIEELRSPIVWMIGLTALFKTVVTICTPFFLPYMMNELHFTILDYVALTAVPFVGRFLFLAGWGRASQDLRPFIGLQIACIGISIVPAIWALKPPYFVYLFLELSGGVLWGGFELCAILIVQRFRPKNTLRTLGLHMSLMSAGSVLGAWVGSQWMKNPAHSYRDLFVLSSSLRMSVAAIIVIVFLRLPATRVRLKVYGEYLTTVLSLRPSFANVGRLLAAPRRSRRP